MRPRVLLRVLPLPFNFKNFSLIDFAPAAGGGTDYWVLFNKLSPFRQSLVVRCPNKTFMKRTLLLFCLAVVVGRLSAQTTVSFNFSAAAQPVSGWINVAGDPSTGIRTASDPTSGISISSVAIANWIPSDASAFDGLGASGGTFFPAAVMLNHWYQFGGSAAVYSAAAPQLLISGLHADSVYTLRMAGSSTSSSNSNPTDYTVSGQSVSGPLAVNSHNNTANGAVFTSIAPDASGTIRVYVNTLPSTDVADICGIQITASAPPVSGGGGGGGRWQISGTTVYDSVDNIAIGTSNPQGYKLAVNGTAIFTKVKVKPVGAWPDYVFGAKYEMPDLDSLEKYVAAYGHLPGVLSEKEVQAQGIDVGLNQAALLEKVEELTLYLIRQNRQLKEQVRGLTDQQKQIDQLKALIKAKIQHDN
jgi:hypothetical protein